MHERRFLRDLGPDLQLVEWGRSGVPVLYLHGFLEQGAAAMYVAPLLDRHVVAPDLRGFGRSAHNAPGCAYAFFDYTWDVVDLIDHLGGRVHLVGHSMGGTIASLVSGMRPDRVASLTLLEGVGPPASHDRALERAQRFLAHRETPRVHPPVRSLQDAVDRMARHHPTVPRRRFVPLAARVWRPGGWTWDAAHRTRSPRPFDPYQFNQFLRAITAPTLSVYGAATRFGLDDLEERENAIPTVERIVLPEAGHMMHLSHPRAVARAVSRHIDRVEAGWTRT